MEDDSITFLGTAGDTSTINKRIRASGGIIINYRGSQIHLDPGPGSLIQYRNCKINPRNTIATIVTNYEMGHCADVNPVLSAMTHEGLDNRGVLIGSKSIIEGSEHENPILWKRCRQFVEKSIVIKNGERVGINDYDIHAISSETKDPTGFGLKIYTQDFTIAYTSDTRFIPSMARYYEDADIIIIKCVYPDHEEKMDKISLGDVKRMVVDALPRVAILTGYGSKMVNSDPQFLARELHRETGVRVLAAHDGMSINPMDYSKKRAESRVLY